MSDSNQKILREQVKKHLINRIKQNVQRLPDVVQGIQKLIFNPNPKDFLQNKENLLQLIGLGIELSEHLQTFQSRFNEGGNLTNLQDTIRSILTTLDHIEQRLPNNDISSIIKSAKVFCQDVNTFIDRGYSIDDLETLKISGMTLDALQKSLRRKNIGIFSNHPLANFCSFLAPKPFIEILIDLRPEERKHDQFFSEEEKQLLALATQASDLRKNMNFSLDNLSWGNPVQFGQQLQDKSTILVRNPPSGFWNNVQQNAQKILDNLNAMAEILGDDFNTIYDGNLKEKRDALPKVILLLEILNALDDPNNLRISENTLIDPAVINQLESSYSLEIQSGNSHVDHREAFFDALNKNPIEAVSKWLTLMQSGGESSR